MNRLNLLVDDLCYEIDLLKHELLKMTEGYNYYKDEYNKLLNSSIKHSNKMMGNILEVMINKDK